MSDIRVRLFCAKKIAHVLQGSNRNGKILKVYRFKEEIPFVVKSKEIERYDFGSWSVSERQYTDTIHYKEYCEKTKEELKRKILSHYLTTAPHGINKSTCKQFYTH